MKRIINQCRLCAKEKHDLLYLLSKEARKLNFTAKLTRLGIKISLANPLPKFVCSECLFDVENFVKFIDKVNNAQAILQEDIKVKSEGLKQEDFVENVTIKEENENSTDEVIIDPITTKHICIYCDKEFKFHVNLIVHMKEHDNDLNNHLISSEEFDLLGNDAANKSEIIDENSEDQADVKLEQKNEYSSDDDATVAEHIRNFKSNKSDKAKYNVDDFVPNDEFNFCKIDSKHGSWNDYTWFCSQCQIKCDSANLLRSHWINTHQTCCKYSCVDCVASKKFIRYRNFLKHVYEHRPYLEKFCFLCNVAFNSKRQSKSHFEKSHNTKSTCYVCAETFPDHETYDNHMVNIAKCVHYLKSIGKYVGKEQINKACNVCGKVFKNNYNLKVHLDTHEKVRKRDFACQFCAKSFYNKGALKTHEALHLGVYYQCDMCDKRVQTRPILLRHLKLHTNSFHPYPCEKCGKIYKSKTDLNSHVKYVHELECRFECEFCKKKFRYNNGYKIHLRQHTGEKPYACDTCSHYFANYSNFSKHMKRKHGICIKKPVLPLKEEYAKRMSECN